MSRWRGIDLWMLAVPIWSAMLTFLIAAPWLRGGQILSYDMVWVPHLDLDRPEMWGLGSGLPRAVPSDAVAALAGSVLPAAVVQRTLLIGALFLLALGAARLLRGHVVAAQLTAATFAVWNPYVAERLVLGQWPVLIALAAFPWLIAELRSEGSPRWAVVTLALAATALSPVTGVMGLVLALCVGWRTGALRLVLLGGLVNAPWIVAGVLHAGIARTDPIAVRLFELQGEGAFGRLGSALSLGGIWNAEVVPTSRTLTLTLLIAVVIWAVMLMGLFAMWHRDLGLLVRLAVAGAIGLAIALAGWLAPDMIARVVADVPGGGIVRDGTRWLALLLPLEAVALGYGVGALFERAEFTSWERPVLILALLVPVAALPDLAWGVGGRLEPVSYPPVWADARRTIDKTTVPGDVLALPFSAYRRPTWNHDHSVLDPAGRFFTRTTVTNDALDVSGTVIAGEDPRAARIAKILANGKDVPRRLVRQGIGIVVIDIEAPEAKEAAKPFSDVREIKLPHDGLRVLVLDGARPTVLDQADRKIMIATWTLTALTLLLALISLGRRGAGRLHRQAAKQHPRNMAKT